MDGVHLTLDELTKLQHEFSARIRHKKISKYHHSGEKRSHIKGRGIDFAEVREYQLGDDVRTIDWRTSARTQKTYTRIYQEEKERPILLSVNLDTSMRFASKRAFKSIIAAHFATLIANICLKNKDKIGAIIHADQTHLEYRPCRGKRSLQKLIQSLHRVHEGLASGNGLEKYHPLERLKKILVPSSIVVIISDFQTFSEQDNNLYHNIAKHSELLFVFVYDKLEQTAPKAAQYAISNGKALYDIDTRNSKEKHAYEQSFKTRFEAIQTLSRELCAHFIAISTEDDLVDKLNQEFVRLIK